MKINRFLAIFLITLAVVVPLIILKTNIVSSRAPTSKFSEDDIIIEVTYSPEKPSTDEDVTVYANITVNAEGVIIDAYTYRLAYIIERSGENPTAESKDLLKVTQGKNQYSGIYKGTIESKPVGTTVRFRIEVRIYVHGVLEPVTKQSDYYVVVFGEVESWVIFIERSWIYIEAALLAIFAIIYIFLFKSKKYEHPLLYY